jgi:hypothetical protein
MDFSVQRSHRTATVSIRPFAQKHAEIAWDKQLFLLSGMAVIVTMARAFHLTKPNNNFGLVFP